MATRPGKPERQKLTPREIAEALGIGSDKVLGWIHSGELRAINVATKPGDRPRYLIDKTDLAAFEARRSTKPSPTVSRRPRTPNDGIIDFF